jgi:hypothetical protein
MTFRAGQDWPGPEQQRIVVRDVFTQFEKLKLRAREKGFRYNPEQCGGVISSDLLRLIDQAGGEYHGFVGY